MYIEIFNNNYSVNIRIYNLFYFMRKENEITAKRKCKILSKMCLKKLTKKFFCAKKKELNSIFMS